jgi:outer membrane biosynthesis protein TonB
MRMGAPAPDMNPADEASAESLLSSLRTIAAGERRKHATVYNYWLSIRRDRDFPPIHDLDPLEISDAGPFSLLLEMIGGGEDADIRHIGQAIKAGADVQKVGEAPNPSLLSKIAARLPVVAACRDAFAFEDEFETAEGKTRCWVTLLPFSETGTWIDYVYGFVSLDAPGAGASEPELSEAASDLAEVLKLADTLAAADDRPTQDEGTAEPTESAEPAPVEAIEEPLEDAQVSEPELQAHDEPIEDAPKPGFSAKLFEKLASAGGFYGKPVEMDLNAFEVVQPEEREIPAEPEMEAFSPPEPEQAVEPEPEMVAEPEPEPEPETQAEARPAAQEAEEPAVAETTPVSTSTSEGVLQNKLAEVRAKADEARQAKLRANTALYEGLSAAYDFALDAEEKPEEYLKLVEAQGLKIQLRSPMKPVAKLAFDGMCDDVAIKQLEAILAWAFEEELPRGTLAERIEAAGGIGPILSGEARAA